MTGLTHLDVIPAALVDELREHLDSYEAANETARREINDAVDMGQLVHGLGVRDRSLRHFTRLIHVAEGASLALRHSHNAAWEAAVSK